MVYLSKRKRRVSQWQLGMLDGVRLLMHIVKIMRLNELSHRKRLITVFVLYIMLIQIVYLGQFIEKITRADDLDRNNEKQ